MSQRMSGYARAAGEVYETPPWVARIIAGYLHEHLVRELWDPANGPGSKIATALRQEGFVVHATNDDFLQRLTAPLGVLGIVTNPPYGTGGRLASQFIAHALELAPVVAMLLRVDFDSSKTRVKLFRDNRHFVHKIVLLDRITWFEREGAAGPSDNHAWFIWNRRFSGLPTIIYDRKQ
jgi:hypothetical protein